MPLIKTVSIVMERYLVMERYIRSHAYFDGIFLCPLVEFIGSSAPTVGGIFGCRLIALGCVRVQPVSSIFKCYGNLFYDVLRGSTTCSTSALSNRCQSCLNKPSLVPRPSLASMIAVRLRSYLRSRKQLQRLLKNALASKKFQNILQVRHWLRPRASLY